MFPFQDSGYPSAPPRHAKPGSAGSFRKTTCDATRKVTAARWKEWGAGQLFLIVAAEVSLLQPSGSHALTPDRDIALYAHHPLSAIHERPSFLTRPGATRNM